MTVGVTQTNPADRNRLPTLGHSGPADAAALAGIYGDNFPLFKFCFFFPSSEANRGKPSFHDPPADLAAAGRKVREMKRPHEKEPSALRIGRAPTGATAAPLGGSTPLCDRVIRNTAIRFRIRLCATSVDLVFHWTTATVAPSLGQNGDKSITRPSDRRSLC